jgi:hypothetical protein
MHKTSISGNRDLHKLLSEPTFVITIALFTLLPYGDNGAASTKTPPVDLIQDLHLGREENIHERAMVAPFALVQFVI